VRIGIFFQSDDETNATSFIAALKEQGVCGSAYKLGPNWEQLDGEELAFNFSGITHLILLPAENSMVSRWVPFLAGFAMGGGKSLCFYVNDSLSELPSYLRCGKVFTSIETIKAFLDDEGNLWEKTYRIERAREMLISLGIGINEANLAQRASAGDEESVENFLAIGYSADTADQGVPILILATRNGHRKVIDLLMDHKADVNVISADRGNTALMEAAVRGDEHCVRRFLEGGANPDLPSKSGQTALMLAVGEGHKHVVKAILAYRPNIAVQDQLGMTAKKYAELFRHEEILAMLEEYIQSLVQM